MQIHLDKRKKHKSRTQIERKRRWKNPRERREQHFTTFPFLKQSANYLCLSSCLGSQKTQIWKACLNDSNSQSHIRVRQLCERFRKRLKQLHPVMWLGGRASNSLCSNSDVRPPIYRLAVARLFTESLDVISHIYEAENFEAWVCFLYL